MYKNFKSISEIVMKFPKASKNPQEVLLYFPTLCIFSCINVFKSFTTSKKVGGELSNINFSEAISCLKMHNTPEEITGGTAEAHKVM